MNYLQCCAHPAAAMKAMCDSGGIRGPFFLSDAFCELESVDPCAGGGRDRQVSLGPAIVNAWGAD